MYHLKKHWPLSAQAFSWNRMIPNIKNTKEIRPEYDIG